jgi:hypothetical protein
MRRQQLGLIPWVLLVAFVDGCGVGRLDRDTALKLARNEQDRLAATWASDFEVVQTRLTFAIEEASAVGLAPPTAYPRGQLFAARLLQKLSSQDGPFKLVKSEKLPRSELAAPRVLIEYGIRSENKDVRFDAGRNRVRIQVATPVVESVQEFVERGSIQALAKVDVAYHATSVGAQLFHALDQLRKEEAIDPKRLDSPRDDLLV